MGGGDSNFEGRAIATKERRRIARVRFNSDDLTTARKDILRGFGIDCGGYAILVDPAKKKQHAGFF